MPAWAGGEAAAEKLAALPSLARLVLTNSVVLAVILGVGLNLALNHLLPGGADGEESP